MREEIQNYFDNSPLVKYSRGQIKRFKAFDERLGKEKTWVMCKFCGEEIASGEKRMFGTTHWQEGSPEITPRGPYHLECWDVMVTPWPEGLGWHLWIETWESVESQLHYR